MIGSGQQQGSRRFLAGTTTALNSGKSITMERECPNMDKVGRYFYNGGLDGTAESDATAGTAKGRQLSAESVGAL